MSTSLFRIEELTIKDLHVKHYPKPIIMSPKNIEMTKENEPPQTSSI